MRVIPFYSVIMNLQTKVLIKVLTYGAAFLFRISDGKFCAYPRKFDYFTVLA